MCTRKIVLLCLMWMVLLHFSSSLKTCGSKNATTSSGEKKAARESEAIQTHLKSFKNISNAADIQIFLKTIKLNTDPFPKGLPFYFGQTLPKSSRFAFLNFHPNARSIPSIDGAIHLRPHFLLYNNGLLPLKHIPHLSSTNLKSHSKTESADKISPALSIQKQFTKTSDYIYQQIIDNKLKPLEDVKRKKVQDIFSVILSNVHVLGYHAIEVERQVNEMATSNLKRNKSSRKITPKARKLKRGPVYNTNNELNLPNGHPLKKDKTMENEKNVKVYWFFNQHNQLKPASQKDNKIEKHPYFDFKLKLSTTIDNSSSSHLRFKSPESQAHLPIRILNIDDTNKIASELNFNIPQEELRELLLKQFKRSKHTSSDSKSTKLGSDAQNQDFYSNVQSYLLKSKNKIPKLIDLLHTSFDRFQKRSLRSRSKRSLMYSNPIFQNVFSHYSQPTPFVDRFFSDSQLDFLQTPIFQRVPISRQPCLKVHNNLNLHIHNQNSYTALHHQNRNLLKLETTTKIALPNDLLLTSSTLKVTLPPPIILQMNAKQNIIIPQLPNLTKKYTFKLTPSLNKTLNTFWNLPSKQSPAFSNTSTHQTSILDQKPIKKITKESILFRTTNVLQDQIKNTSQLNHTTINQSNFHTFDSSKHDLNQKNTYKTAVLLPTVDDSETLNHGLRPYLPKVLQEEINYTAQFAHGSLRPADRGVKLVEVTTSTSGLVDTTKAPSWKASQYQLNFKPQTSTTTASSLVGIKHPAQFVYKSVIKPIDKTYLLPTTKEGHLMKNGHYSKVLKYNTLEVNITSNSFEQLSSNSAEENKSLSLPVPFQNNISVHHFNTSTPPPAAPLNNSSLQYFNLSKPSQNADLPTFSSGFDSSKTRVLGSGPFFVRLPPHKAKNFTFSSSNFPKDSRNKQAKHHNLVLFHLKNQQGISRPKTNINFVNSSFDETVTNTDSNKNGNGFVINNRVRHNENRSDIPVEDELKAQTSNTNILVAYKNNENEYNSTSPESTVEMFNSEAKMNESKKQGTPKKVLAKIIKRPVSKTNKKNLVVSLLKSERLASM